MLDPVYSGSLGLKGFCSRGALGDPEQVDLTNILPPFKPGGYRCGEAHSCVPLPNRDWLKRAPMHLSPLNWEVAGAKRALHTGEAPRLSQGRRLRSGLHHLLAVGLDGTPQVTGKQPTSARVVSYGGNASLPALHRHANAATAPSLQICSQSQVWFATYVSSKPSAL